LSEIGKPKRMFGGGRSKKTFGSSKGFLLTKIMLRDTAGLQGVPGKDRIRGNAIEIPSLGKERKKDLPTEL